MSFVQDFFSFLSLVPFGQVTLWSGYWLPHRIPKILCPSYVLLVVSVIITETLTTLVTIITHSPPASLTDCSRPRLAPAADELPPNININKQIEVNVAEHSSAQPVHGAVSAGISVEREWSFPAQIWFPLGYKNNHQKHSSLFIGLLMSNVRCCPSFSSLFDFLFQKNECTPFLIPYNSHLCIKKEINVQKPKIRQ